MSRLQKVFLFTATILMSLNVTQVASVSAMPTPTYSDGMGGFVGTTYFQDTNVSGGNNYSWISPVNGNMHGSYTPNAVMPNWVNKASPQGGALGLDALGLSSTGEDSQVLKQKLYDHLQRRNTYKLHGEGTSAGEWDKRGSALVVHTMLGNKFESSSRKKNTGISAGEWEELKLRLVDNPEVKMEYVSNYNARWNTAGVMVPNSSGVVDFARYVYESGKKSNAPSWIFKDGSGNVIYALEIACANPLGELSTLPPYTPPPSVEYSLTPAITAPTDGASVQRGESVQAAGSVVNSGSNAGVKNWYITRVTYGAGTNPANKSARNSNNNQNNLCAEFAGSSSCTPASQSNNTFNDTQPKPGSSPPYTIPSDAALGSQVCFVVSVRNPTHNNDNPVWRHSAMRCVMVAREFALVPTIDDFFDSKGDGAVVDLGTTGSIEHSVRNDGADSSTGVEWRLTHYIYSPGSRPTDSQRGEKVTSSSVPCSAFPSAGRQTCTHDPPDGWVEESQVFGTSPRRTPGEAVSYKVPDDMTVGTSVCWVASVRPPTANSSNSTWRHSAMYCLTVGKKPKVQVWGGDVRAGGEINTSISTIDGQTYGSWGEYAALSNRQNSGFATGSGLNEGAGSFDQSSWSQLTFANTGVDPGCSLLNFGCYGFTLASPLGAQPLVGQFKVPEGVDPSLGSSVNLNSLASGTHKRAGSISLTGTTISQGKSIVIEATDTVTITGNIRYSGGNYSSVHDIPQVVIRAPVINIEDRVERVDAWLLAVRNTNGSGTGALNTCSNRTGGLTANICDRQLTINGPVVAERVLLRRTAGSGATADERHEPAEIFNLRADAYLWGRGYGSHSNQVRTVHIRELSPRF